MSNTLSFILLGIVFSIIGGLVGYLFFKFKNRINKKTSKIIKDPKLLLQELKKHGKIIDVGSDGTKEEIEFSVETNAQSGKEELIVKRTPVAQEPPELPDPPTRTSPSRSTRTRRKPNT